MAPMTLPQVLILFFLLHGKGYFADIIKVTNQFILKQGNNLDSSLKAVSFLQLVPEEEVREMCSVWPERK